MSFLRPVVLVFGVVIIVVATLLPFGAMPAAQIPPRWCVRCGGLWLTDAISNVALFMPLGVALAFRGWRPWWAAALALCVSLFVEGMQAAGFPPGRSAATADLITNTLGGLLGATLVLGWRAQQGLSARAAAWLCIGWTVMAVCAFGLTTVALGPRGLPQTTNAFVTSASPLKHVPGHQWYEGINDSAFVDGVRFSKGWSGPFIAQANREHTPLRAGVTVRHTDPLRGRIPLLFVHLPQDSAALLMIAKHGNDAELLITRRAWDWGLSLPSVLLPNAFADRSLQDPRPLSFVAVVTPDAMRLEAYGAFTDTATVRFTPVVGWALVQTVVSVQSPLAPFMLTGWLFCLLAPVGWWGVRCRVTGVGVGAGLVALGSLVLTPHWSGIHAPSGGELFLASGCLLAGALFALGNTPRALAHAPEYNSA